MRFQERCLFRNDPVSVEHYSVNLAKVFNVGEGVGGEEDEVGMGAGFDLSDIPLFEPDATILSGSLNYLGR
jgi:hypothetical protein